MAAVHNGDGNYIKHTYGNLCASMYDLTVGGTEYTTRVDFDGAAWVENKLSHGATTWGLHCGISDNSAGSFPANTVWLNEWKPAGINTTNFGWNQVKKLSAGRAYFKKDTDYTLTLRVRFWSPWGLSEFTRNVTVPKLKEAAKPPAPTVSGTGNSRSVTCPAVTNGVSYALYYSYNNSTWTRHGSVTAGTAVNRSLTANSRVWFRYTATGYNGVEVTGATSGVHYTQPSAPSNLTAAISGANVKLAWTNNATYATGVLVQRSTTSNFAATTDIYKGAVVKELTYTPPSGTYYYRVYATGPSSYGNTGPSNTATAITMLAPDAPSNLVRTGTFNSNTIALSWTRNASASNKPYSSIAVETSTNGTSWTSAATLAGTATAYSVAASTNTRRWIRIRAVNAAGNSAWVQTGPHSTTLPALSATKSTLALVAYGNSNHVVQAQASWGFASAPEVPTGTTTFEYQYSTSSNNGSTWSSWASIGNSTSSGFTSSSSVTNPVGRRLVKLRCRATRTGWGGGTRTSNWSESSPILVGRDSIPATLTYNKSTKAATIRLAGNDWYKAYPRRAKLYVDNVLAWELGSNFDYTEDGTERVFSPAITPPKTNFTLKIEVTSDLWDKASVTTLTVENDTHAIMMGNTRYHVILVHENGVIQPCSVSVIR
ncbi:MAG: hypothetical protein FWD27_00660 [Coriobacteriia bacterium]|nr:hypothetical protein [Coriobacteriia bacterium]